MQKILTPGATSPLAAWFYYLERLHATPIELGLDRVSNVARQLDLLEPAPYIFTVSGTNGKGTTCCILEAILIAAGYRVGVYTSPHLLRYTERVKIQGQELADNAHSQALAIIDEGRKKISLTYFEFTTLSALYLFKQANLDVVILEVGLGGRLDATNIIDTDVAIITSIGIDHTDWLGSDRESIGYEKAGIFRHNKPAIIGEFDMPNSIDCVAKQIGVTLYRQGIEWSYQKNNQHWSWQTNHINFLELPLPKVPLTNAATAISALSYSSLSVSKDAIEQGLVNATLPGRLQIISHSPLIMLDVAHNPHAAAYLAQYLVGFSKTRNIRKIKAIVGMLVDKDIPSTLACLQSLIDDWYCVSLGGSRGASAKYISQYLLQWNKHCYLFDNVKDALLQVMNDVEQQDLVIVFGSFYTVAGVIETLNMEDESWLVNSNIV